MEYITAIEASKKWGVSLRQVQRCLANQRVPNAKKYGRAWMIPSDAKKPIDIRREKRRHPTSLSFDLNYVLASTTIPMPCKNPDAILDILKERRLQLQYEGELAYLRGNFQQTLQCYNETEGDDVARMRACPIAICAAISLGDYQTYNRIDSFLRKSVNTYHDSLLTLFAELTIATVAVSVLAPNMVPDWVKEGDFSQLPLQVRINAFYLRARYFQCMGRFESMLISAQTALAFSTSGEDITQTDLYLRITYAVAAYHLGRKDEAKKWLLDAMNIALPHGFVTPFAEQIVLLGGLVEQCVMESFPSNYNSIISQWKRTGENWIAFHNQFTKENLTKILSLREYHIALLVASRVPYAVIAKQFSISIGRLKNIMQEIYEKLFITNRRELMQYVMGSESREPYYTKVMQEDYVNQRNVKGR